MKDRHKSRHGDSDGLVLPSHHHSTTQKSTPQASHGTSLLFWMIIDGIGLAMIAGATILDGVNLWHEFFHSFLLSNYIPICLWISGRTCQLVGLFILIGHAASYQVFHFLEYLGLFMLTVGPALNLIACYLFDSGSDPRFLFNKQWCSSETLEIVGIFFLDISMIDMHETYVLIAEQIGYVILCMSALLDFDYDTASFVPRVDCRLGVVHTSEAFGLVMLSIVAVAQYRVKVNKHLQQLQQQQQQQQQGQLQHKQNQNYIGRHNSNHQGGGRSTSLAQNGNIKQKQHYSDTFKQYDEDEESAL